MIDKFTKFTKQEFESYLKKNHSPFKPVGLIDGEETYLIPLDSQVSITIRSSVKSDGLSADVGKDSIRCWLVNGSSPLGSKVSKWTTRQVGWQDRLDKNIKQLVLWRALAGDCKECGQPKGIFKVKKNNENKGRPFARCREHNGFVWLDKPIKTSDIYFSEASNHVHEIKEMAYTKKQELAEKTPNNQQKQAIEAHVNQNIRVLAGPGSGKTFVIEKRYQWLVNAGIEPSKIIVCTFGKQSANDMGQRILRTCPTVNLEQVCTIHAFCYRLLTKWHPDSRWYGWRIPRDWQIKKILEDIIYLIWQESEKPNTKEVFNYINTSKYLGLTTDDSYAWFVDTLGLGQQCGSRLYEIRSKFDAWLNRNKSMTFADMLFLVEQQLKNDSAWRTMVQEKFSHVIIDESQDTNYQAMRILITISLEPGMNTVYESEFR